MSDSKSSIETQVQVDAAASNGWGWDLDEIDYVPTDSLKPSPPQSKKEIPKTTVIFKTQIEFNNFYPSSPNYSLITHPKNLTATIYGMIGENSDQTKNQLIIS